MARQKTQVASSSFSGGNENPLSESGAWQSETGTGLNASFQIANGAISPTSNSACASNRTGGTYNADQYSQVKRANGSGTSGYTGVILRGGDGSHLGDHLDIYFKNGGNDRQVYAYVGGTQYAVSNSSTSDAVGVGTLVEGFVTGSSPETIVGKVGGTQQFSVTCSRLASGRPGVLTYSWFSNMDDWAGGDWTEPPSFNPSWARTSNTIVQTGVE